MSVSLKSLIADEIESITPDKKDILEIKKSADNFIDVLNKYLMESKINAEAFIGGSFARNTLIKDDKYDVDIFVRFDWRYDRLSIMLEKVLRKICKKEKLKLEVVHGSRDYFKVYNGDVKNYFEIIPVTKINKPQEERNVTDLSYFHVDYIRRKIKGLENEVRLAKKFFKANKVYGAETYVQGFSGYSLELLIIHYGSFLKMIKELSKVKERLVIDIGKKYKTKGEVFIEMNEAKIKSPIILVDPTYKERNALAALSRETFIDFQEIVIKFLKKPSKEFFIEKEIDLEELKKSAKKLKSNLLCIELSTNKQAGDIAGTKLKKFSKILIGEMGVYFEIKEDYFEYGGLQKANLYLILKSRKEVVRIGPPLHLKKFVNSFKKEHSNTFEKNGMIHSKIKINFTPVSYFDVWRKSNKDKINEMGISEIKLLE